MKKQIILVLAIILVFGFNLFSKEVTLGEKIKTEKVTRVSDILAKPDVFMDKTVRVGANGSPWRASPRLSESRRRHPASDV